MLLRQFDSLDNKRRPWEPCPSTGPDSWCKKLADRWASAIINPNARHTYLEAEGGLLLAPSVTLCAAPRRTIAAPPMRSTAYDRTRLPTVPRRRRPSSPDPSSAAGRFSGWEARVYSK